MNMFVVVTSSDTLNDHVVFGPYLDFDSALSFAVSEIEPLNWDIQEIFSPVTLPDFKEFLS